MSISIASAFRLRNKLKERIKELTSACERTPVSKHRGTEENTAGFDGKSFADSVAHVSLLMAALRDFNLAIEKANMVNKEDLITLETLKAELAFYDTIKDGSLRIIDWECAGMAGPLLDIALAAVHQGFDKVDPFTSAERYLRRKPDSDEIYRLKAYITLGTFELAAWQINEYGEDEFLSEIEATRKPHGLLDWSVAL